MGILEFFNVLIRTALSWIWNSPWPRESYITFRRVKDISSIRGSCRRGTKRTSRRILHFLRVVSSRLATIMATDVKLFTLDEACHGYPVLLLKTMMKKTRPFKSPYIPVAAFFRNSHSPIFYLIRRPSINASLKSINVINFFLKT